MTSGQNESHSLRGPVDRAALLAIRDLFEQNEPLATATLDDLLNPSELEVRYNEGLLSADQSRIDIQWTTRNDYKYHYTDTTVDFRWGRHPHDDDVQVPGLEHYHPPSDASPDPAKVEASCINQRPETIVTRAVIKLWRAAYHANSLDPLNTGRNPPE